MFLINDIQEIVVRKCDLGLLPWVVAYSVNSLFKMAHSKIDGNFKNERVKPEDFYQGDLLLVVEYLE